MQSVYLLSRGDATPQHAISYVPARESMDRTDRAQGIRLIARASAPSFVVCFFPFLYLSLISFSPFSLSLSAPLSPRKEFLRQERFSIRTGGCTPPLVSRFLVVVFARVHPHGELQRTQQLRNWRGESSRHLALNTRPSRCAVTSQSELQTVTSCCFPTEYPRRVFLSVEFLLISRSCS